ncbi:MAG TPA: hypothetical protein VN258_14400 [Mobilitalea sp.]|nr:hypothetical protein [Mobilitalea sp.]
MKKHTLKYIGLLPVIMLILLISGTAPLHRAEAETAAAVAIGEINYEELTMQIYNNNNSVVYYSVDESNWFEVEGAYNSSTKAYTMDISWVSASADTTLYFKGDVVTSITSVVLPMQDTSLKVTYNKVDGSFTFTNADASAVFVWRKITDYSWNTVSLDETSASYKSFLNVMELLRTKGAKIIIRIPQIAGTASNVGSRPSKEVTVTITARAEQPSIRVNSSKLTINTSSAMEYYDSTTASWIDCTKSMLLSEIAPKALYANGAIDATLMIRTAATTKATYSKTAYIKIKGQRSAPEIGDNSKDVTYYYMNKKLVMLFNKASATNVYEYTIVKSGASFNLSSARWTSVSSTKLLTLSNGAAPDGCTVYVRKKGTDANSSKNVELVLSSAISNFAVDY